MEIKKKKNSRGHFWELSDELFQRIRAEYRVCINSVYVQGKDFLKVDVTGYYKKEMSSEV